MFSVVNEKLDEQLLLLIMGIVHGTIAHALSTAQLSFDI